MSFQAKATGKDQWIMWDVDDVITKTSEEISKAMLKMTGIHSPHDQWEHHDFLSTYQIGPERIPEMIDIWAQEQILERAALYDGIRDAMALFASAGYKNGLITARGWHPKGKEITEDMIHDNHLPVSSLMVLTYEQSKAERLKESGLDVRGFLDDTARHALACAEIGIPSALRSQPWNATIDAVPRLSRVSEFPSFVQVATAQRAAREAQADGRVSPLEAAVRASAPKRRSGMRP